MTRLFRTSRSRLVLAPVAFLALSALQVSTNAADAALELVIFGDGYSDTGNAFHDSLVSSEASGFPAPPYFDGRFSNGPLWIELLASDLQVRAPQPSLLGGSNYARQGAAASLDGAPSIGDQVDAFLDSGRIPSSQHLFVIWAGAEDFNNCDFETTVEVPDPSELVQNLSEQISKLAAATAPGTPLRVLVGNLPPLGQTARARWLGEHVDEEIPALFDRLSMRFNALLTAELTFLRMAMEIEIIELDVFALSQEILAAPADFGFFNITDAAREGVDHRGAPPDASTAGTGVSPNASGFLFFDDVYPTSTWHEVVAVRAMQVVSERIP